MEQSFWQERWSEGRIGFHRASVSPELEKYVDVFNVRGTVLVPLCGKTLDLVWLAARFERVVGVEFVRQAAVDFFAALEVTPTIEGDVFRHQNLEIHVRDFFAVTHRDVGPIDAVWDRAALIALPEPDRARYAAHVLSLMSTRAIGLLVTLDYPQELMAGPPFAVSDAEVVRLFPHAFQREHHDLDERRPNLPADARSTTSVFTYRPD